MSMNVSSIMEAVLMHARTYLGPVSVDADTVTGPSTSLTAKVGLTNCWAGRWGRVT